MSLKKNRFVHLRNYSQYSLSKGALRINQLIDFCQKESIPATTITDFNNLFGSLEFCIDCQKSGIQPIIGINILIKDDKFIDGYILLLCKNEVGYKNLVKLISDAYLDNSEYNNPFTNFDQLKKYKDGLICLAGGCYGLLTKNYNENQNLSNTLIDIIKSIFGSEFFLEIQRIESINSFDYENYILKKSFEKQIPIVATNENFFLNSEFYNTHDALLSIAHQTYIDSDERVKSNKDFYLKSPNEMIELFNDIPQAIENTILVAKKCSFFLKEKLPSLPKIESSEINENDLLTMNAHQGLINRLKSENINDHQKDEYFNRLDYELKTITDMGYSSYFLIVSDFINWAKKKKIPVGPGRGSGAGSLVAWCLSITDLNPIKFGLIFERFLNPERVSLPDFDVDFCMDKRDEVIRYVQKKYGLLNVAQIITFGSFQPRAAIRDVGRVLQLPLSQVDNICKMIPYNPGNPITLNDFISETKQIKKMIANDSNIKSLFEISSNLEGLLRHASTHAAGIVIAEKSLDETIPLYKDPKSDIPVTQFSMKYVEKIGLIKFDFLGLKTLTVIDETCKNLKRRSIDLNINNIKLDDSKTYEMLRKGYTTGVFQLEGQGMRETIVKVKPDRFEDLIAIVSLYRPGPMDNIPTYINRKQNKESYSYIHDDLKEILDETYGIMVYQEQVMLIAQKLAGFSLAKADLLRRAMGKKIKSEMDNQRENFVNGCKKNNIHEEKAANLFNEISKFAGYGFNKSHAAAYAMIAYQTAYLKSNYPMEFFCALMNCDINNFDKLSIYCGEIKKLGFEIIAPDINLSDTNFIVNYSKMNKPLGIKFGLGAVKNIGETSIKELVNERKGKGKFKNLVDLLKRVSNHTLNKKVLEALIFSNSLKSLLNNQKTLFDNIEKLILFNSNYHKNFNENQSNLFPEYNDFVISPIKIDECNWNINEKLEKEIDAFGFYLSEHPTSIYKKIQLSLNIKNLDDFNIIKPANENTKINSYIALINNINERKTKLGKRFCFFNISDDTFTADVICFSEVLDNLDFELNTGEVYNFKISKQKMGDSSRLVVSNVKELTKYENKNNSYNISLIPDKLNYDRFKKLLDRNLNGNNKVFFRFVYNNQEIKVKSTKNFRVDLTFLDEIKSLEGVLNIKQIN